jgi:chaperonin GroES
MAKLRIQPLGENVLIRIESKKEKTASGLYLPESVSGEREQQGVVVALGSEKAIAVKKGDTVIFKRYGTSEELKVADVDHILINYKDILAVVLS